MKLVFSPEAVRDIDKTDAWWRENRADAPRIFAEEFAYVCEQIMRKPLIFQPYCRRHGMEIRRWLMGKTERHVYYEADLERDTITILRVWGARRGRGPKL